ncbi:SafA/ExsA family spore coat assembly protein [Gracilibacillus caseinilyticus]|uniref:SafA/ExsA family spore coat assembly protein n=1 Tax=Gracilibacillus caseinilyticus TaxID=2932256 RepID=UPI002738D330|nr:SafA/ExsA family spore coat assembly protein [Gracilibacillus caseinilyticus]
MKIHIVQKDESLWTIAQKYGVSLDAVIAANPQISNPDMIMPGMKIKVPTGHDNHHQMPPNKKQQVTPGKKDKQEVKPPTQILPPKVEEDDDKKWEPLKKEMPPLPIHFNKQQPAPAPSHSQDLKWTQLTNNFEANFYPTPIEEEEVLEEQKVSPQKPVHPVYPQQPQAPCYSSEGIPYGYGPVGQVPPMSPHHGSHHCYPGHHHGYPGQMPQQMPQQMPGMQQVQGAQQQAPSQGQQGWYQAQMPSNQMMPSQQQQMMPQMQQQQGMQQQPIPMQGDPMIPQPGMPNYPMMPLPSQGMPGQQPMPYPSYGPQGMPHNPQDDDDCGCGGSR